ncbi:MAG: anaerobic ribonucleoside-triphosphate reductase activating protein [Clostridia bacterium]|nr:anaerobic ribonucleoside-triphosphate reductase activating protein [Clostridia bacterium]
MDIYGLEKMSLVDYCGYVSCVVFTRGCNFRCPFCHNSSLVNGVAPQKIQSEDFFAFLNKRRGLLDGVCITGGEPTLNPDLPDFIRKIKDMGLLVKLDTNGTNPKMLESLISQNLVDYVAMDIKNGKSFYPKTTGVNLDFSNIEESVALLKKGKVPFEFRTTLVAELHSEESIIEMGKLVENAPLLVLQKFTDNGNCLCGGLSAVPREVAEKWGEILQDYVKKVEYRYN